MKLFIIAGCGGGHDIFCGLPLYHKLSNEYETEQIVLVSFSFTEKELMMNSQEISKKCYVVNCTQSDDDQTYEYFPEHCLAKILQKEVYAFVDYPTCNEMINAYKTIISNYSNKFNESLEVYIFLVDGGSDSLMTGKEIKLGTPVEDIMQMKSVFDLQIDNIKINKYLSVLGANVDVGHGILLEDITNRLEHLEKKCLISKRVLNKDDSDVQFYIDIFNKSNPRNSIVNSLIVATIEGYRGYYVPDHLKTRIINSVVDLTLITCTFYVFDLKGVIEENVYYQNIDNDMDCDQVDVLIGKVNGYIVY
jgi:hypothetical protein